MGCDSRLTTRPFDSSLPMNNLEEAGRSVAQRYQQGLLTGIGAVIALIAMVALLLLAWACVRVWIAQRRLAAQRRCQHDAKYAPDGHPYPPLARGICDNCQTLSDDVFFLKSGARLCRKCYGPLPEK